jgi:hypothetical protein
MARLHSDATLSPTKLELITPWLAAQAWAPSGEPRVIGSYRFDDPAGRVGIEAFLLEIDGEVVHLPLTYRAAALEGAEDYLLGTVEHSVLGTRWVYDASVDPVAVHAYLAAMLSGDTEAELVLLERHREVGTREPSVRVHGSGTDDPDSVPPFDGVALESVEAHAVVEAGGWTITIARRLGDAPTGEATLSAVWEDSGAVVAAATYTD